MPNFWLAVILVAVLSNSQQLFGFSWQNWLVSTNVVTSPNLTFLRDPALFLRDTGTAVEQLIGATKQILPAALVLSSSSMGNEMRIGRTAVLETIHSNYVETARAKGLPAVYRLEARLQERADPAGTDHHRGRRSSSSAGRSSSSTSSPSTDSGSCSSPRLPRVTCRWSGRSPSSSSCSRYH